MLLLTLYRYLFLLKRTLLESRLIKIEISKIRKHIILRRGLLLLLWSEIREISELRKYILLWHLCSPLIYLSSRINPCLLLRRVVLLPRKWVLILIKGIVFFRLRLHFHIDFKLLSLTFLLNSTGWLNWIHCGLVRFGIRRLKRFFFLQILRSITVEPMVKPWFKFILIILLRLLWYSSN